MSRMLPLLLVTSLFLSFQPTLASAQILEEDDTSYIYKGFFISADLGLFVFAKKPTLTSQIGAPEIQTFGLINGLNMGFDIGQYVSLQFSFWSINTQGDTQTGGGNNQFLMNLGATIFLSRSRLTVYIKVGAGLMVTVPLDTIPLGLMIHGGLGLRYFTRFKHFSIGLEALALIRPPFPENLSIGVAVMPTVTYTF